MIQLGVFFFQAEDGIRDLVRSRGLGDVYKRQVYDPLAGAGIFLNSLTSGFPNGYNAFYCMKYELLSLIHI